MQYTPLRPSERYEILVILAHYAERIRQIAAASGGAAPSENEYSEKMGDIGGYLSRMQEILSADVNNALAEYEDGGIQFGQDRDGTVYKLPKKA